MRAKNSSLSGLLALLLAVASLSPLAAAQGGAAPAAPAASAAAHKGAWGSEIYVIVRNEKGEAVCRLATPEERGRMTGSIDSGATRVIYSGGRPVKGEGAADSLQTTGTGVTLQASAGLRIELHSTDRVAANPTVRDAFIAAANKWEAVISTPITVILDVDYGPDFFELQDFGPDTIGATSSDEITRHYPEVRQRLLANSPEAAEATLYNALPAAASVPVEMNGAATNSRYVRMTLPVARALGFTPASTAVDIGEGDASIGFNSGMDFDFNPNDGIDSDKLDFDATAVHEIGHALGFVSNSGDASSFVSLTLLDLFRVRPGTFSAGNLATAATAQRVMSKGGTQVFFNNRPNTFGSNETQLATGGPTGNNGGDGDQSSHWKDDSATVPFIGVMDPSLADGVREVLNDNDKLAFDMFGYKLAPAVAPAPPALPAAAPPANDNFANAAVIQGSAGSLTDDNIDATRQADEPNPTPDGEFSPRTVWFSWTAPANGTMTVDTVGSDYDTMLGAYVGSAPNTATPAPGERPQNDDITLGSDTDSRIIFNAAAGTTYRIMVSGYGNFVSSTGAFVLRWSLNGATTPPPTPSPTPTIQFADNAFNGLERDGTAGILLTRTGDPSTAESVNYQTSGGTATAGADYVSANGTVSFAAGVTRAVLSVRITNDTAAEPAETVNVQLTGSSTGALVGANSTATLTINDDDNFPANSVRVAGEAVRTAAEGAGKVDITVTRTGDLSQAASVAYRTSDVAGGATSLKDYTFASGTLNFAAGDASETFSVLITEDFHDEAEERFNVSLSEPVGTAVDAAQALVQIAIQDDDAPGLTTNPSDNATDFVEQHYNDFLNRVADAGGLGFWSAGITQCGANPDCRTRKRVDTSAAFFLSIEFQETGYLVYRMYKTAYGNLPGAPVPVRFDEFMRDTQEMARGVVVGTTGWPEKLEANKRAFALSFVNRGRFKTAHPSELTPAQFVDGLNANAGGVLSQAERDALVAQFAANNTGAGRAAVLRQIAENQALRDNEFRRAFVLMQYFGYLRRNPNEGRDINFNGFFFWLGKLNDNNGDYSAAEMVRAFLESIEYRQRFGQ